MSIFYLKPRLAFLDDHEGFLLSLQKALSPDFEVEIFTDPIPFQKHVSKRHLGHLLSTLYESGDDHQLEHPSISMALPTLPNHFKTFYELTNPFTHIFVDHAMPQKTGIETLKDLKSCLVHKTLLTGFLNEEQAIEAFHREEINGYLRKDALNFTQTLKETIEKNSHSFYQRIEKLFFQPFPFFKGVQLIHDLCKKWIEAEKEGSLLSCIYDQAGSCVIYKRNEMILFNIYPFEEIEAVILTTPSFFNLSKENQRALQTFEKVLDYKSPTQLVLPKDFNPFLTTPLWVQSTTEPFFILTKQTEPWM